MLGWLYATTKDVNKYSKLYTDQGMDVLVGRISLTDFLSKKRAAGFSQKILDILKINEASYNEIFLHTFSAGGGVWGGVQRQIKKVLNFLLSLVHSIQIKPSQDLEKYGNIPKSVIGQVWDSTGRNDKIAVALPIALFPNRPILQSFVKATLWTYLTLHRPLHHFYVDSINNVYQNMSRAPALIFVSKVDPMGTEDFNEKIAEIWRANGVNVTYKCFENSPHVKHYQVHPEEYLKHLHDLWKLVKLLERN